MDFKKIENTYNRIADNFSRTRTKVWPETEKYLNLLKDGDRILDLGCGNGRLITGIKAKVNYLGIDFSEELLKKAHQLHSEANFIQADITGLETWDKLPRFDAVYAVSVLHHLPEKKQQLFVLQQVNEHLKKNGFFYMSVWNLWKANRWSHHLKHGSLKLKLANWRWMNTLFANRWKIFCFAFDKCYLRDLLEKTGFKNIKIYYANRRGEVSNFISGNNLCAFAKKQGI